MTPFDPLKPGAFYDQEHMVDDEWQLRFGQRLAGRVIATKIIMHRLPNAIVFASALSEQHRDTNAWQMAHTILNGHLVPSKQQTTYGTTVFLEHSLSCTTDWLSSGGGVGESPHSLSQISGNSACAERQSCCPTGADFGQPIYY